jgi:hypothetical protein
VDAPLIDHGDYEWYATSPELPGGFAVVICDGPPGSTKGGRYGLIPVAEGLLRPDVVVLLDDADRPGEQEMLRRWQSESSYTWRAPQVNGRSFAVVTRPVSN